MKTKILVLIISMVYGCSYLSSAQTNDVSPFKAGAARVNITPAPDALPSGYNMILDSIYTKAVVIENGSTIAALISVDIVALDKSIWGNVTDRISKEIGIPTENIFLSPSHSHSATILAPPPQPSGQNTPVDPKIAENITKVENAIVEVARKAKANLQPARIGFGTGTSYLNVNRDVIDPETRLWRQGPNYDGPSDKTVSVIKFESTSGDLIAVYVNYAMHANWMYLSGAISAGLPGGITKYIEEYYKNFYDDNVVALWSMGAAGDQNPVHFMSFIGRDADGEKADEAFELRARMINSIGQVIGEEVIRVLQLTKRMHDGISIYGSQKIVSCPGRIRTDTNNREGKPGTYIDGDPVKIRLSLLKLGDIVLTATDGDCYNAIFQRLKKESPYSEILMASHTNGSGTGYIPSDDAFVRYTFQVLSSALKPGCAENSIVNGLLDMMDQAK